MEARSLYVTSLSLRRRTNEGYWQDSVGEMLRVGLTVDQTFMEALAAPHGVDKISQPSLQERF